MYIRMLYCKHTKGKELRAIELKDWLDVFFKAWTATVATIALVVAIRKGKPPRKRNGKRRR